MTFCLHIARIEDIEMTSPMGHTFVYLAAGTPYTTILKILIDRGAKINVFGGNTRQTPLGHTAKRPHLKDNLHVLLEAGADPHFGGGHQTVWFEFVREGAVKMVELFLKHGADVNVVGTDLTALHLAVLNKERKMADLLLSYGANKTSVRSGGITIADDIRSSELEYLFPDLLE